MHIFNSIIKKGSKISKDFADSYKEIGIDSDERSGQDPNQIAISTKQVLVEKMVLFLEYFNEKEIRTHVDQLQNSELESFYSNLLIEMQHYYERTLNQQIEETEKILQKVRVKEENLEEERINLQSEKTELKAIKEDFAKRMALFPNESEKFVKKRDSIY